MPLPKFVWETEGDVVDTLTDRNITETTTDKGEYSIYTKNEQNIHNYDLSFLENMTDWMKSDKNYLWLIALAIFAYSMKTE